MQNKFVWSITVPRGVVATLFRFVARFTRVGILNSTLTNRHQGPNDQSGYMLDILYCIHSYQTRTKTSPEATWSGYRAFRLVVNEPRYWLKQITWFVSANSRICTLHVERLYIAIRYSIVHPFLLNLKQKPIDKGILYSIPLFLTVILYYSIPLSMQKSSPEATWSARCLAWWWRAGCARSQCWSRRRRGRAVRCSSAFPATAQPRPGLQAMCLSTTPRQFPLCTLMF